jgi:hypothetical protein
MNDWRKDTLFLPIKQTSCAYALMVRAARTALKLLKNPVYLYNALVGRGNQFKSQTFYRHWRSPYLFLIFGFG